MPESRVVATPPALPVFLSAPVAEHHGDPTVVPDVASDFHEATKLHPALAASSIGPALPLWTSEHVVVTEEGLATRRYHSRAHPLPQPMPVLASLDDAVAGRRSTSPPGATALTRAELSTVLALGYGATALPGDPRGHRRPVPSGGAMYPLDLYVGVRDEGIFHYDPFRHLLEELRGPSAWADLVAAGPVPDVVGNASVVLLLVACFARQSAKYGARAYRFCYLEAGHVGQNVGLTASALGLGCLPFGSFHDREVERLLDLDGVHESLVHAVLLGR